MYKRILVPLDGSTRAELILPHVEALARCFGAEVILLRVFEPDFSLVDSYGHSPEFYISLQGTMEEEVKAYLAAHQTDLAAKGFQVRTFVESGPVVPTILEVADREQADVIAMASHGRTGISRAFYGSVTAGVLHRVDRPLLLVRAE